MPARTLTAYEAAFRLRLREVMRKRRLTQKDVSEMCGMSESYIHMLAVGKRSPGWERACRVAEGLEESLDSFMRKHDDQS